METHTRKRLEWFLCKSSKSDSKRKAAYSDIYSITYCICEYISGNRPLGQLPSSLCMKKVILVWQLTPSVWCWRPHYPGCPAEGQSLQRGQVWNMPVFSLMTHSTINTLQLSRSARGYGRVYWLPALVPWRTLSRPADRLPDGSWRRSSLTHAQYSGAQQPHRRRLTHIAAQRDQWDTRKVTLECYFHPHVTSFVSLSSKRVCKWGLFLLTMNSIWQKEKVWRY